MPCGFQWLPCWLWAGVLPGEKKECTPEDSLSQRFASTHLIQGGALVGGTSNGGMALSGVADFGRSGNVPTQALTLVFLTLAARLWRDESGLTWLETAPLLQMLECDDARKPYPLSWDEQARLFARLRGHLKDMALFKVNTGTREQEVVGLRWEWEVPIPEMQTSVFVVPGDGVKNGEDRLVVSNGEARAVINRQRGKNSEYVFTYSKGRPVDRINTKAWRRARKESGLPQVRVHDLKHTFGRRLRARGVSHETRQVLLGHKNGQITTHYSAAEIGDFEGVKW